MLEMSGLDDQLYEDAMKHTKLKENDKALNSWIALMNKHIGQDALKADEDFWDIIVVKFLQSLVTYMKEVSKDQLFMEDDEEDDEDSDESEEEEEEEIQEDEDDEGEDAPQHENTKFFQFGLVEEDDVELEDDGENEDENDPEDPNGLHVSDFETLLPTGGSKSIKRIIEFILGVMHHYSKSILKGTVYLIIADCFRELDYVEDAYNYYEMAVEATPETEDKIPILLDISELFKWSSNASSNPKIAKYHIDCLNQAKLLIKATNKKEYLKLLPEIKEDLDDLEITKSQDIRALHPDFDAVLKRALGQISTDSIEDANDLTNLVHTKKKPKK